MRARSSARIEPKTRPKHRAFNLKPRRHPEERCMSSLWGWVPGSIPGGPATVLVSLSVKWWELGA